MIVQEPRQVVSMREDPPRDMEQVRLEVKHSRHSVSCEGNYLRGKRGEQTTHTILIYKDRLPRVQRMVHGDHEGLRIATDAHARKRAAYVEERVRNDRTGTEEERRAKYTRQYTGSVEAEYFALRGVGIKPFDSIKVLEELESPVQREKNAVSRAQNEAHLTLVAALKDAFPGTKATDKK